MTLPSFRRFPLVALAVLFIAVPVGAQPDDSRAPIQVDEANRLFREGRTDFNEGRVKDAYRKYRTAWKLRKSPDVAANMAQAEVELGLYAQAATHFSYALAYLLPSTSREQRVALEQALADARAHAGEVKLQVRPSDARVTLDGKPVDPIFIQTGLFAPPGGHVVGAQADGYGPADRRIEVAAGSSVRVSLRLQPESSPSRGAEPSSSGPERSDGLAPDHEPRRERSRGRTPVIVTEAALAAAGLGVGSVYLARWSRKRRDADPLLERAIDEVGEGSCPEEATTGACAELQDTILQRDRSQNVAIGGFVAGGVFAVATVVTALAWPKREPRKTGVVALSLDGSARDFRISVGGRF